MSKTIYINKSVLKTSAALSAFGNSGKNYLEPVQGTTIDYNNQSEYCLAFPCVETEYIDKPITFSNASTTRGTNITDISIVMTTTESVNGKRFIDSSFYKYRDRFSVVFSFISNYKVMYNNKLYTYSDSLSPKIKVTVPANLFVTSGEKAYMIASPMLFGNLEGEKHSSGISSAPNNDIWYILESLSLDPNLLSIEAHIANDLNSSIAAEIFVDIRTFLSKPKLKYTQSKPDWSATNMWQKEFTLPETSKEGAKLFLREVNFEYPRQFPLYTHKPSGTEEEYRFMYQAPIKSRSYSTERSLNFKYYSNLSPARILSDFTETLESSSGENFTAIYPYFNAGYREVFTVNTGLPYRYYVNQSFYDSCIFEFTLSSDNIKKISLWELFKNGLTLPAGVSSVKLSGVYLPNIEGFILNNYIVEDTSLVNNLEPRHFYEALSAFSKINLMIDIGYQSANTGIYIDTTKVRKLYIDETEVESFIAD